MGNEVSCTSRGKGILQGMENGLDQMVNGVENAADIFEQAIDDACRYTPAKPSCELADKEQTVAVHVFWQLAREQGDVGVTGSTGVVYEDEAMALCLHRLGLLDADSSAHGGSWSAKDCEPLVEAMFRRLHAFPVGQWLKADRRRRCYRVTEWTTLLQHLQSPALLVEAATVPADQPLPISCLLQIEHRNLLICGCANDSALDKVEHVRPTAWP